LGPEPSAFDGEIEFRAGAQAGTAMVLADGARRWIVGPDGELSASVVFGAA
jgi:hypothetical protein